MTAPIRFVFGVHLHQPVGNFDHVFAQHLDEVYFPFLQKMADRQFGPVVLHLSGPLLDWLEQRPDGTRYVKGELVAGGSGASAGKDGVDVIETDATNCMNLPAEALELDAPIRVHRVALRRDSGGAGAQRGGLGIVREYEILHGEVRFTHRGERHFIAPKGRAGGHDGAMARTVIHRAEGGQETVPSKLVTTLRAGDRVVFETAGGGGYGDPVRRDPEKVRLDLADGKISAEGATTYDQGGNGAR